MKPRALPWPYFPSPQRLLYQEDPITIASRFAISANITFASVYPRVSDASLKKTGSLTGI